MTNHISGLSSPDRYTSPPPRQQSSSAETRTNSAASPIFRKRDSVSSAPPPPPQKKQRTNNLPSMQDAHRLAQAIERGERSIELRGPCSTTVQIVQHLGRGDYYDAYLVLDQGEKKVLKILNQLRRSTLPENGVACMLKMKFSFTTILSQC